MTKTLTEQWREGTLPLGTYYILNINGVEEIDKSIAIGELWNNTDLKEVLAPVPSYDEYKKLQKKLEIAKKALKEINEKYRFTVAQEVVYKALDEINEVVTK